MVSGLDLARTPRHVRLTARKKGSGYENAIFDDQNGTYEAIALLVELK
jgi:hypothetical protein